MSILKIVSGAITGAVRAVSAIRPSARASRHPRAQASRHATPARLSAAQQWDKVSGVLTAAIGSATNARDLQASAAQQLDLATYALYNMFDDLAAVMSEPLVREAASVHHLAPRARRTAAHALAA